jgi:hypothetical protein
MDTGPSPTDGVTNRATLTLAGIVDVDDILSPEGLDVTVQLVSPGNVPSAFHRTTDATGLWTLPFTPTQQGTYTVRADTSCASSGVFQFTWDTVRPPAPPPTLDAASDSGQSSADRLTRVTTPTFRGVTEPNASVSLLRDGGPVTTASADAQGRWAATDPGPVPDGVHTYGVEAVDVAGNDSGAPSPAAGTQVRFDSAAPDAVALLSPAAGQSLPTTQPTLAWTEATDHGLAGLDRYEVLIDGTVAGSVPAGPSPSFVPAPLRDGTHTWQVRAVDLAGNVSASLTGAFVVDTLRIGSVALQPQWHVSQAKGRLVLRGSAGRAAHLEATLTPARGRKAVLEKAIAVGPGGFTARFRLPPHLSPGRYRLSLVDAGPETPALPTREQDVVLEAPPEGVVDEAFVSEHVSGRPESVVTKPVGLIYAIFHFAARPRRASRLHVVWHWSGRRTAASEEDVRIDRAGVARSTTGTDPNSLNRGNVLALPRGRYRAVLFSGRTRVAVASATLR